MLKPGNEGSGLTSESLGVELLRCFGSVEDASLRKLKIFRFNPRLIEKASEDPFPWT